MGLLLEFVCLPDSVKPQLTPHFLLYAVPTVTAELGPFSTLLLHLHAPLAILMVYGPTLFLLL